MKTLLRIAMVSLLAVSTAVHGETEREFMTRLTKELHQDMISETDERVNTNLVIFNEQMFVNCQQLIQSSPELNMKDCLVSQVQRLGVLNQTSVQVLQKQLAIATAQAIMTDVKVDKLKDKLKEIIPQMQQVIDILIEEVKQLKAAQAATEKLRM